MKKICFVILMIILLTGCNKNETNKQVNSIIKKENNTVIAIHYPEFNYPEFDKIIKNDVNNIYKDFLKNNINEKELNIDYQYNILNNRFINVVLQIYIKTTKVVTPIYQVKVYQYDIKENKILTLKDIISKEELKKLIPKIKTNLIKQYRNIIVLDKLNKIITPKFETFSYFYFDDNDLILYFDSNKISNQKNMILSTKISLDLINLSIPLERGVFQEEDVLFPEIKKHKIDCNKPMIALTFDDGPSKYTNPILQLLKKYDARATFFVIGNKVELYKKTLRNMVLEGHEIGNHSYNHKWLTKVSDDELINQISTTQNLIQETTGITPKLFRPTYGSINQHLRQKITLDIIMWSMDTADWKTTNFKKIAENALNTIKNKDIVLMHDTHKQTYEALKIILPQLKNKDYQFVTVSELNEICPSK